MRALILLLCAALAPFQDRTRPGERLTLDQAIARAAPGAVIDARLYRPPLGNLLVLERSLTLAHARLSVPIVIDEPADEPVLVRLVDVQIALDLPNYWFGAVETYDPFSALELEGCAIRTNGHFGVLFRDGAVRVHSSWIEVSNPDAGSFAGCAVSGERVVVVRSTCIAAPPWGWAVGARSLYARESLFVGGVSAAMLDLETSCGGRAR